MGKFNRTGRGIPSLTGKTKKRKKKPTDPNKLKRTGELSQFLDVVPFLKWLYRDGQLSFLTIEELTGIGIQTVKKLVRKTDADPLLQICQNPDCLRIVHEKPSNAGLGYCSWRCYHKVVPKPKAVLQPRRPRHDVKPCAYNLSCGGSVLMTNPHGLCVRCREKLPERKHDRHLKNKAKEELRAQGLVEPRQEANCVKCGRLLGWNNKSGQCIACRRSGS